MKAIIKMPIGLKDRNAIFSHISYYKKHHGLVVEWFMQIETSPKIIENLREKIAEHGGKLVVYSGISKGSNGRVKK